MEKLKSSRTWSFVVIALVYVLAFAIGVVVFRLAENAGWHYLWGLFTADVAATVVVWFFGLLFRNVSVYDPYWSVAPPLIYTFWTCHTGHWSPGTAMLLAVVWLWAVRLTGNWAYTFRNLGSEDWRYAKYRTEKSPAIFQLINFFGLNLMPTVVVFLAMTPGFFAIEAELSASSLPVFAFMVCLAAVLIQALADYQRHRFVRENPGKVCDVGLWKYGRHPNYYGEIMMWTGVFLFYLPTCANGKDIRDLCIVGMLLIICLFRFISVPLMEKRQLQNKPEYKEYQARTRMFI